MPDLSPTLLAQIRARADAGRFAGQPVTPLHPFLAARAHFTNDTALRQRLTMIAAGQIPNTPAWCATLGTAPPVVEERPRDGRWLFTDAEVAARTPSPADGV